MATLENKRKKRVEFFTFLFGKLSPRFHFILIIFFNGVSIYFSSFLRESSTRPIEMQDRIGFFFPSTFDRSSSSSLPKLFTSGGLEAANIDNRYRASSPRHRPRATLLPRYRGNYYGGLKTRLLLPATKGSPIFGNSFNNRRNNPICPVVENYSSSPPPLESRRKRNCIVSRIFK